MWEGGPLTHAAVNWSGYPTPRSVEINHNVLTLCLLVLEWEFLEKNRAI